MPLPVIPIEPPYTPEILEVARFAIEAILADGGRVFEYGSGHSTLWFAGFAKVYSVEHEKAWYDEVKRALKEADLSASVRLVKPADYVGAINRYADFDLVFVDGLENTRPACIKVGAAKVKPGGYLVVDDSWRVEVQLPCKALIKAGWRGNVVRGQHRRKDGTVHRAQITFYRKPA